MRCLRRLYTSCVRMRYSSSVSSLTAAMSSHRNLARTCCCSWKRGAPVAGRLLRAINDLQHVVMLQLSGGAIVSLSYHRQPSLYIDTSTGNTWTWVLTTNPHIRSVSYALSKVESRFSVNDQYLCLSFHSYLTKGTIGGPEILKRWGDGRHYISLVVIYRKCTQRTTRLLCAKRRLIKKIMSQ